MQEWERGEKDWKADVWTVLAATFCWEHLTKRLTLPRGKQTVASNSDSWPLSLLDFFFVFHI